MKTREIVCEHYQWEGSCSLGRESEFFGYCQHCPDYKAKKGAKPARVNNKRKKLERGKRRELKLYEESYR